MTTQRGPSGGRSRVLRDRGFRSIIACTLLIAVLPVAVWAIENPALVTSALGGYVVAHIVVVARRRIEGEQHPRNRSHNRRNDPPIYDP